MTKLDFTITVVVLLLMLPALEWSLNIIEHSCGDMWIPLFVFGSCCVMLVLLALYHILNILDNNSNNNSF